MFTICPDCSVVRAGVTWAAVGLTGAKLTGLVPGEVGGVTLPPVVPVVGVNPVGRFPCTQSALGGV